MLPWELKEVRQALFWAVVGSLAEIGGALLGILAVLRQDPEVPLEALLQAAQEVELPEHAVWHALAGLHRAGLVDFFGDRVVLRDVNGPAAEAAWRYQGSQPADVLSVLRAILSAGEEVLAQETSA